MKNISHNKMLFLIFFSLLLILFILPASLYSQDSIKIIYPTDTGIVKSRKDTAQKVYNFFIQKSRYHYVNLFQPDTITRNRFLWYPLKSIEEVFNYLPGYYSKYMDVGQRQNLNYDQLDEAYTGVFRHGRPINDLMDGSFDLNLFSRNEISEIELTNGFGNFLYNYANGINVIQRQIIQNKPYSEISFWQDRYENLYLDANYHQNLWRKLNFNFGITKHSYDGKYTNSDFDKWLGRFNFNFPVSNKVNAFLYANYSHIQRGLNGGVNPDTININDKEAVFNSTLAIVRNPDAYEIRTRFDIDAGAIFLTSKDSTSFFKFQLFESNAFRKYADEENRPTPNGIFLIDNSHWINYGIKFQNVYNFKLNSRSKLTSETEAEYNYDIIHSNLYYLKDLKKSQRLYFFQNLDFLYKNINLGGFVKSYRFKYFSNSFFADYGVNVKYTISIDSLKRIEVLANYGRYNRLPTYQQYWPGWGSAENYHILNAGVKFCFKQSFASLKFFNNNRLGNIYNLPGGGYSQFSNYYRNFGLNFNSFIRLWKLDLELDHTYNFNNMVGSYVNQIIFFPRNSGNLNISFHDMAFKNKLEYKIGAITRYWSSYYVDSYDGFLNEFYTPVLKSPSNATLDFYIIGKINKATFGLTFENLLNRVIYTAGFYPYMDRGGLANVISRFNITWYFLN